MHYNFGIQWLKAFRESADAVCRLYGPGDDFLFEDPMLDQHGVSNQADLHRLFAPYANKDRSNGIGVHNFRIRSYIGNRRFGLLRWEWSPEDAAVFLGLDVRGKPFTTMGHTFHLYGEDGLIRRESSWWDAAKVLRASGLAQPSKIVTGALHTGELRRSGDVMPFNGKPGTLAFARHWCEALGRDTEALLNLYADRFTSEWVTLDDHLEDSITDAQMLRQHLGGIADGRNGTYTFTPTEYLGDASCGLILYEVSIEGAETYRGLPTQGRTLKTIASTFHEYDEHGRIVLETTRFEDNRVFQQLGLPIVRPHYWKADFDPTRPLD